MTILIYVRYNWSKKLKKDRGKTVGLGFKFFYPNPRIRLAHANFPPTIMRRLLK